MTDEQIDPSKLDLDLVRGELSRRSLKKFAQTFWPMVEPGSPFIDGWLIDCLCDHLANLKDIGNLLINMPSRCGKSLILNVFFPAWVWINKPSEKFLYTSYAVSLAERDSVRCRRLIDCPLYQKCYQSFTLSIDQNTKVRFTNDKGGQRLVSSIDGACTGEGASSLVCDDPHGAKEADSEALREVTIRWFTDTWLNRLDPGGTGRIICGQRIHRFDLSGFILENYKDTWTHLCLPYEYRSASASVPNKIGWVDPRTEEGQPLWPERFPDATIRELKRKAKTWHTQYQQNPTDSELSSFDPANFQSYDEDEEAYLLNGKRVSKADCWRLMSCDLAVSTSSKADYTVIATADITRSGDIIIRHIFRDRLSGTKLIPEITKAYETWHPVYVIIEDQGFQKYLVAEARASGLPIRGVVATASKETRSLALQGRFENKQVWFPKEASWLSTLQSELMDFPGLRDDQVDALSHLAQEANRRTRAKPTENKKEPEKKSYQQVYQEGVMQGLF